jgi:transposase
VAGPAVTRRAGLITERIRCKDPDPRDARPQPDAASADERRVRASRPDLAGAAALPPDEREAVEAGLRQITYLNEEIARLDRARQQPVSTRLTCSAYSCCPGVS